MVAEAVTYARVGFVVSSHVRVVGPPVRLSAAGYCIPLFTRMEYPFSEKNPRSGVLYPAQYHSGSLFVRHFQLDAPTWRGARNLRAISTTGRQGGERHRRP